MKTLNRENDAVGLLWQGRLAEGSRSFRLGGSTRSHCRTVLAMQSGLQRAGAGTKGLKRAEVGEGPELPAMSREGPGQPWQSETGAKALTRLKQEKGQEL